MGTAILIILCLLLVFMLWVRYTWHRDPMRILRYIFKVPDPDKGTGRRSQRDRPENRRKRQGANRRGRESIIPKEYAEDVEYTETREYSKDNFSNREEPPVHYHEEQVSDAEWEDLK